MQRLTEQVYITKANLVKQDLTESTKLIEDSAGNKYAPHGVFDVELSRYDNENLNGRIYSLALWERVIEYQKHIWQGQNGLADHPEDEGSTHHIFCVWTDLYIHKESNTIRGKMALVGEHGARARQILEAGGKVGLSSSGFGDFLSDGKTIDPETFELERPADWVLTPSQEVFAQLDNKVKENISSSADRKKESTKMSVKTVLSLEEKRLKLDVKKMMENVEGLDTVQAQLTEAQNLKIAIAESKGDVLAEELVKVTEMIEALTTEAEAILEKGANYDETLADKNLAEATIETLTVTNTELVEKVELAEASLLSVQNTKAELVTKNEALVKEVADLTEAKGIATTESITVLETEIATLKKDKIKTETALNLTVLNLTKKLEASELKVSGYIKQERNNKLTARQEGLDRASVNKINEKTEKNKKKIVTEQEIFNAKKLDENEAIFGTGSVVEVQEYFQSIVEDYGDKANVLKKAILECKTVSSATNVFFNNMDMLGSNYSEDIQSSHIDNLLGLTEEVETPKKKVSEGSDIGNSLTRIFNSQMSGQRNS